MRALLCLCILLVSLFRAPAHDEPSSYVDLQPGPDGLTITLTASTTDFAHYLPSIEPAMLLHPDVLEIQRSALSSLVRQRLRFTGLTLQPVRAEVLWKKSDILLEFHAPWAAEPETLAMECRLFPYDPRHRTFVTVRRNGAAEHTQIFHDDEPSATLPLGKPRGTLAAMREFFGEGIHHIFIGPDHILFVIGLLLLGGGVARLLKIVTAFTFAHSITLGLATFQILTPPAAIIEPVIALSIVIVGIHALMPGSQRDPRLVFAFLFGIIHGFGFAFALGELNLPRAALGWALLAFNGGVEIGQACIILAVAPLLAILRQYSPRLSERAITALAACVIMAGTFWFVERITA
jgi:hydrogenase/urease accessory protein HupE